MSANHRRGEGPVPSGGELRVGRDAGAQEHKDESFSIRVSRLLLRPGLQKESFHWKVFFPKTPLRRRSLYTLYFICYLL